MAAVIVVDGKFKVDDRHNPPPLKSIERAADGTGLVHLGPGAALHVPDHVNLLDSLLDQRLRVEPEVFRGLGNVDDGCAIYCVSNSCTNWAAVNRRPRVVATVVGVMADEPRFLLLTVPRFRGATRARRETRANRADAGLVAWVLHEPGAIECPRCPGPNRGVVHLGP